MIGAIVYQLTKNLTEAQIKAAGFEDYFVDHTTGIYPANALRLNNAKKENRLKVTDGKTVC